MKSESADPLLKIDRLEGSRFKPIDLVVTPGTGVIVHSRDQRAIDEFIDLLNGLAPRKGGDVLLFGSDPALLGDAARLEMRREAGYTTSGAGLISNLKVWENLVLPLHARGLASTASEIKRLEDLLVEAFAVAGCDESWIHANMGESTDRLSEFQKIICGLLRCHLAGFRLLIGDCIFGGVDSTTAAVIDKMLDWIGGRHPDSGLLLVHHGRAPDGAFGLSAWEPIESVALEVR